MSIVPRELLRRIQGCQRHPASVASSQVVTLPAGVSAVVVAAVQPLMPEHGSLGGLPYRPQDPHQSVRCSVRLEYA